MLHALKKKMKTKRKMEQLIKMLKNYIYELCQFRLQIKFGADSSS